MLTNMDRMSATTVDQATLDEIVRRAIRNNKLFHQFLHALIELADSGKEERQILKSLSNHGAGRVEKHKDRQMEIEA